MRHAIPIVVLRDESTMASSTFLCRAQFDTFRHIEIQMTDRPPGGPVSRGLWWLRRAATEVPLAGLAIRQYFTYTFRRTIAARLPGDLH